MVFNLIDFLLGAKKPKNPQQPGAQQPGVAPQPTPAPAPAQAQPAPAQPVAQPAAAPAQQGQPQEGGGVKPGSLNLEGSGAAADPNQPTVGVDQALAGGAAGAPGRTRISDAIIQIQEEAKNTSEKMTSLITDIKNIENSVSAVTHKVDELDEARKSTDEKLSEIDGNMTKFLSLYELINNQYNPFVSKDESMPKKIVLDSAGNTVGGDNSQPQDGLGYSDVKEGFEPQHHAMGGGPFNNPAAGAPAFQIQGVGHTDLDSAILELDTLNIEEAAGDAVPLTHLKTNTNSLVTILSWLEYLIKKVGVDETRNTLRYYTEVLRWITPEVFFDLDKYLKGMTDKKEFKGDESLSVKDHIVSLYFISKLNEKTLDEQLTRAVLRIIKQ